MKRFWFTSALVCFALFSVFLAPGLGAQTFERTVFVSPVPGDPLASGQALVAALGSIPNASEDDPWLLKIEPGVFDLGESSLRLREWIDVEGSGLTVIEAEGRADLKGATVIGANHVEVRQLRIVARAFKEQAVAIGVLLKGVNTRFHRVSVVAEGGTQGADGFYIVGGAPRLSEVEVTVLGSVYATGIVIEAASSASITNSIIRVSGASDTNRGILLQEAFQAGEPMLHGVHVAAHGGKRAYGLVGRDKFQPPPVVIESCTLLASGGSLENAGVVFTSSGGAARLVSSVVAGVGPASYGVWAQVVGVSITVSGSEISGETATVSGALAGEGLVTVSHSLLAGGPAGPGTVCAGVTDEAAVFHQDTCP